MLAAKALIELVPDNANAPVMKADDYKTRYANLEASFTSGEQSSHGVILSRADGRRIFAAGNVLGPFVIGHFFDTIGRKKMISGTYAVSGMLLALTAWLFHAGMLTAQTQTLAWTIIFFVASAAASSAYLTVSEIFPLEIRAMAIAIFYAIGTLASGVGAPVLFGWIIGTGSRGALSIAYLIGAGLMIFAAIIEAWIGVAAERKSLEQVAMPLSSRET